MFFTTSVEEFWAAVFIVGVVVSLAVFFTCLEGRQTVDSETHPSKKVNL
ncbi:hypothetical protein ACFYKX_11090 [Cytobacillus sp. FJAT-54145]|uniref:Uncharacterized protein n=1 Tax=Cytobacillus spartinae TaxID=3299023 RepID=A0ABW6KBN1_9BACI